MRHRIVPRWIASALMALAVLTVAGCGGQAAPSSWPGLTGDDGVAYLAATTKAYAVNVVDGTMKWEYTHTVAQTGLLGTSQVSDPLHAKPAVYSDTVFFGTDGGYLVGLNATTGTEKWPPYRPELPSTFIPFIKEHPTPDYAGPAVDGNRVVFVGTGDKVYAVDADTGKPSPGWEPFSVGGRVWGTPLVEGDTVYITTLTHDLIALDAATGKPRWTFDKPEGALAGSATFDNGIVYVGSFDKHLYAVDAATGQERWSFDANNWIWEGPTVVSNTLYFGDLGGNVYALDATTQQVVWAQPFQAEGAVRARPLYDNGVLYVGTDSGALYALDAATGKERWAQPFKVPNARFLTTPVLEDDLLLVAPLGTPTLLYGLNPSNGQTQWQFPTPTSK